MNSQPLIMSQIDLDALADLIADRLAARISQPQTAGNEPQTDYLTRKQAAAKLSVSLPTLNELTRSGKVPAYRIGRRVLYRPSDLENALKKVRA